MDSTELGQVFSATRVEYEQIAPVVWDPAGTAVVKLTAPSPGARVLDACCGIGSSAIPAAEAVGPSGTVDAVDLAGGLLELGRERAAEAGLSNIRFVEADVTTWEADGEGGEGYDLVQCVYGVFLLPDMDAGSAHLARLVRPGGRFAVAVWRGGAMEAYAKTLHEVVQRYRPPQEEQPEQPEGQDEDGRERPKLGAPIERVNRPDLLRPWLESLGLAEVEVHTIERSVPLDADLAWRMVLGSGYRATLTGMDADTVAAFRTDLIALLTERGLIDTVDLSTLIGIGTRATA